MFCKVDYSQGFLTQSDYSTRELRSAGVFSQHGVNMMLTPVIGDSVLSSSHYNHPNECEHHNKPCEVSVLKPPGICSGALSSQHRLRRATAVISALVETAGSPELNAARWSFW